MNRYNFLVVALSALLAVAGIANAQSSGPSDGGGSSTLAVLAGSSVVTATSGASTCSPGNRYVLCDASGGAITLTLAAASATGQEVSVITTNGTNSVTVVPGGTDVIVDPNGARFMGGGGCSAGESVSLLSLGTGTWYVIESKNSTCTNWTTNAPATAQTTVNPGTASDQTLRWDATTGDWITSSYLKNSNSTVSVGINTGAGPATGTIGKLSLLDGTSSSGYQVTFQPNTGMSASTTYTLPPGYPTVSGYVLSSTTGGVMSWSAAGASVNSVSATAPLSNTGTASDPVIALTGVVGTTKGGTGLSTYTLGDIIYSDAANSLAKLAGNTTATKKFLNQTGTGAVSAAPAWSALVNTDLPVIDLAHGGTNANLTASNGGIFYSTATAGAILAGTATANQILMSGASTTPAWSTATYPATTTINQLLYSSANNVVGGLATGNNGVLITSAGGVPSISSTLPAAVQGNITSTGTITSGTWTGSVIDLAHGGTNANLSASNGGIFYSTATAGAVLAGTATANQMLLSGASGAPAWSTATHPATTTINQLLYSSANNVIGGLATGNNGVLITSAGGVPSISSTLPAAVQGNITSTGTITSGTWTGSVIDLAHGGTNANLTASNGGIFYSTATAGAVLAGTATANQMLLSGASGAPAWSTATHPATTTINQLLYSSANNVIGGLATGNNGVLITSAGGVPSISSTLPAAVQGNITSTGTITSGTWTGSVIDLAHGGTNANLSASNGGIFYSTATAGAVLSGTATANQLLMSGASTTPAWSTATYPATTTINQLLYSSAANVVGGLATGNNGVLITSAGGVPSISSTLPNAVQDNITRLGTVTSGTWSATTIATTKGGTGLTAYTLGDVLYSDAANSLAALAGNTTATKKFLTQTGTGAVSAAPAWGTIVNGDLPVVDLSHGGTNANLTASNGGIFYSTATAGAILAGTATANQLLLSGASGAPAWSTETFPASTTVNQILYSSANNVVAGLATANNGVVITTGAGAPQVASALPNAVQDNITRTGTITTGVWNGSVIDLAHGGTNANLSASNGGIFYSTAAAGAVLSGTATANQLLMSGASTTPAWSTATYPASTTVNQLLYSSAANVVGGLATGNNGVLITSAGGVPSISSTLPSAVQGNITSTGTITSGTWNGTSIADANVDNNLTISGGTIDNSVIGGTTPAAGTFSTVSLTLGNMLSLQNPAGTKVSTFAAGTQAVDINYTLPTTPAAVNGYVLSSTTGGALSWVAQTGGGGGGGVTYDASTPDATATPSNYLFNVTYNPGSATTFTGAVIDANGGSSSATDVSATALTLTATAKGTGTAIELALQGTGSGASTFTAGAQGATNLNYVLPTTTPSAGDVLTVNSVSGSTVNLAWSPTPSGSVVTTTFTTGTSFVVPTGVTNVTIEAVGASGGGAASASDAAGGTVTGGGGGGGAGEYVAIVLTVTPGSTITYALGVAGARGTHNNSTVVNGPNGSAGTATTVTYNASTVLTANGGSGGVGSLAGVASGGAGGAGGTGSTDRYHTNGTAGTTGTNTSGGGSGGNGGVGPVWSSTTNTGGDGGDGVSNANGHDGTVGQAGKIAISYRLF